MVVKGKIGADQSYRAGSSRSGTKTNTPLEDTPQSVTVITRALVADQAMQNMADVVRYMPGVSMGQGEGHRDQPTIRGNSSTADFFVDGFRDDAQYFRDLYNAEQIESLRGSNAMIFGRGGAGGVINRVGKEAMWTSLRGSSLEGGSADHKRASIDFNQPWTDVAAGRFNAMYENSGAFRDRVRLRRFGINPVIGLRPIAALRVSAGYEHFDDRRTVDRGIPSFQGAPSAAGRRTFFGQPDSSYANTVVDAGSAYAEMRIGSAWTLRNRARAAHYDKFYQNIFPGSLNASGTQVNISGYNNGTQRTNLINQTEAVIGARALGAWHTLLAGVEVGHQASDNLRNTGYFNGGTATSINADFTQPTLSIPVEFRQSATDADNHVVVKTGAIYLQDQVALSPRVQAILGLRAERFDIAVHNNRDGSDVSRVDEMLSPRIGLVIKPVSPVSLYGSYSVSHLPSSGDQFSSLTAT
ncbi:MAG: TonB-dependent receptor, partial [Gemmatimonadaceae bacterium]